MKAKIIQSPEWRKTLLSMNLASYIETEFRHEGNLRRLSTILKKEGFEFSVKKTETGISVTRLK